MAFAFSNSRNTGGMATVLVYVAENVVEAMATHDVRGARAGDPLGCLVPIGDSAFQVRHVNPVAQRVADESAADVQQVVHDPPL